MGSFPILLDKVERNLPHGGYFDWKYHPTVLHFINPSDLCSRRSGSIALMGLGSRRLYPMTLAVLYSRSEWWSSESSWLSSLVAIGDFCLDLPLRPSVEDELTFFFLFLELYP